MNNLIAFPLAITFSDVIQVVFLYIIAYYLIKSIYDTRAWILAKGLMALLALYGFFWLADFTVMTFVLDSIFDVLIIGIIIMFQPQLQQFFERIGSVPITELLKKQKEKASYCKESSVNEILDACTSMSGSKTGALIVIERKIPLSEYAETGIKLDGYVSTELLLNIFEKNTPLHDGAVIVQGDRIVAATCYLPLTQSKTVSKKFGTRHRAAIGISETTDAIVIVVSEETGKISLCVDGKIQEVNQAKLTKLLIKEGKMFEKSSKHTSPLFKAAIIFGTVLSWLFILSVNDPVKTIKFSGIPVTIQNEQVLSDLNKYYSVTKGDKVDVLITARSSQLRGATEKDIEAVADMKNISITYSVPVDVSSKIDGIQVEISGNQILSVEIEDGKQLEQEITMNVSGSGDVEKYLHKIETSSSSVILSGPKSLIDTIDKAVVNVDLDSLDEAYAITVFDRNGEDITRKISLNLTEISVQPVYLEISSLNLEIKIGESIKTVPVSVASIDGKNLKDIFIEIEVTDELATIYTIDVQKYLPEGVYYTGKDKIEIALEEVDIND